MARIPVLGVAAAALVLAGCGRASTEEKVEFARANRAVLVQLVEGRQTVGEKELAVRERIAAASSRAASVVLTRSSRDAIAEAVRTLETGRTRLAEAVALEESIQAALDALSRRAHTDRDLRREQARLNEHVTRHTEKIRAADGDVEKASASLATAERELMELLAREPPRSGSKVRWSDPD